MSLAPEKNPDPSATLPLFSSSGWPVEKSFPIAMFRTRPTSNHTSSSSQLRSRPYPPSVTTPIAKTIPFQALEVVHLIILLILRYLIFETLQHHVPLALQTPPRPRANQRKAFRAVSLQERDSTFLNGGPDHPSLFRPKSQILVEN